MTAESLATRDLRLSALSALSIGAVYLLAYLVLDRLSFLHPFGTIGITAWNPQVGLSFALVIALGRAFIPFLFAAPLITDLVLRKVPPSLSAELLVAFTIGAVYASATFLLTGRLAIDPRLERRRDLLRLISVAAIAVLAVALICVGLLVVEGYLDSAQAQRATLRYWVGDFIGIAVVTPFALILYSGRPVFSLRLDAVVAAVVLGIALVTIFGPGDVNRFQLFYLLFVPVIYVAVRFGLEGASGFLLGTQISLVAAIQMSGQTPYNVTNFQTLMLVLALTGLTIGVLVSESRYRQRELWLHREALGRAARVGGMGELAAALAHELNQPLMATANYIRLVSIALEKNPPELDAARDCANKSSRQVERAATVVRRLRDFIRAGKSELEVTTLSALVDRTISIYREELDQNGIDCNLDIASDIPEVEVDSLQVEQVVLNLLRNSIDALTEAGRIDGRIEISARLSGPRLIEVCFRDNGPGFEPTLLERDITPFATTKVNGMGLGLSLSKSIIAAHGGELTIEGDRNGAVVRFTLPTSQSRGGA